MTAVLPSPVEPLLEVHSATQSTRIVKRASMSRNEERGAAKEHQECQHAHTTSRNAAITAMPTTRVMLRRLIARLACILPISL